MTGGRLPRSVDVLVVGAGPAGSAAAEITARAGLSTLLLDRRRSVGVPVRCGEYVPRMLLMEIDGVAATVASETRRIVLHLPDGTEEVVDAPGLVLDRDRFDAALAGAALAAGAGIMMDSPFAGLLPDGCAAVGGERGGRIKARVIVGADGPASSVARAAGLARNDLMLASQRVVKLRTPLADAHVHFLQSCMHGYGWLFPKGDVANLGAAVAWGRPDLARRGLGELWTLLVTDGTIEDAPPLAKCWGLVPSGGPHLATAKGQVLLAGDAAGQVDPLTGAGIAWAVRCGRVAGNVAAAHLRSSRRPPGNMSDAYELAWRSEYGSFFDRALVRRNEFRTGWSGTDLSDAVRRSWLGTQQARMH